MSKNNKLVFLLLAVVLMGCGSQTEDKEQSFSSLADHAAGNEKTENIADPSDSEPPVEYAGETITQMIEGSDGRKIWIDAQVHADGIGQVSCYRYVPEPFTEVHREDLLKKMHPAEAWNVMEAAAYDPEKDAWEFVTPGGESWIYQIIHSEVPGEEILDHENTAANVPFNIKQVFPAVGQEGMMGEDMLLIEMLDTIPAEIETMGLQYIGSIDQNVNYSCSFIHICETDNGQFYAKAVYRKILDGLPVTAWHDFSTVTGKGSPFPVKVWGSFFSEDEIGLDRPILSAGEAVAAMQEQIDLIPVQKEPLSVTEISLEYLSVISSEGDLRIVPVWRFRAGEDEAERILRSEDVIAINAVSGELIWENRRAFTE